MFLLGRDYQRQPCTPCASVWDRLAKPHLISISLQGLQRWQVKEGRRKEEMKAVMMRCVENPID